MSDSSALCCYGSGFALAPKGARVICVNHLKEAYECARMDKDIEMMAVILKYKRDHKED